MPSRSLPNTDNQRFCALQACFTKADVTLPAERPISVANFTLLGTTFTSFSAALSARGASLSDQANATAGYNEKFTIARQWVSHFIQTLNLAIDRGVFPASVRAYYMLDVNSNRVPAMTSEKDMMLWGQRVQTGEAARVAAGGTAIPFPTIAEVADKVGQYDEWRLVQSEKSALQDTNEEAVAAMRPAVDALIKDLWDEIEFAFRHQSPSSLRAKAREWGVVYESRPGETPEGPVPGKALVTVEASPGPGSYAISLTADGLVPYSGFDVFERLAGGGAFVKVAEDTGGTFTRNGLVAGNYELYAVAKNESGIGPASDVVPVVVE